MELITALITYNLFLFLTVISIPGKLINANGKINTFQNKTFKWNIHLVTILLIIMLISGLRPTYVGTDYNGYLRFYTYIMDFGHIGTQFKENEFLWEYLNLTFAKLNIYSEIFFGFIAGIIYYFFIKGSYRFQYLLPLMIFFVFTNGLYFWTMSGLRQSISIMIFFYTIRFIIEKRLFSYILWIIIASLFHKSALILLPIYFLKDIKFNPKLFTILFTISILFIGNTWFIERVEVLIQIVASKIDSLSSYLSYLQSQKITADENRLGSGLGVILKIMAMYFILYKSTIVLEKLPSLNIYFILFFIGAIFTNIFFSIELIGRVLTYLNVIFPILIASSIYYSNNSYEKIISIFFLLAYLLTFNKQIIGIFSS